MTIADHVKALVSQPENQLLLRNMNVVTSTDQMVIDELLKHGGYVSKEVPLLIDNEEDSIMRNSRTYAHQELPGAAACVQSPKGRFLTVVPEEAGIRPTNLIAFSTQEWNWTPEQRKRYCCVLHDFFHGLVVRDASFGIYDSAGFDHDGGVKHYFEFV